MLFLVDWRKLVGRDCLEPEISKSNRLLIYVGFGKMPSTYGTLRTSTLVGSSKFRTRRPRPAGVITSATFAELGETRCNTVMSTVFPTGLLCNVA